MSYAEIIKRALKGRSVNATAKAWGVQQMTLSRYANGTRLPDYVTAKIIAKEAGISSGEMLEILAEEEGKKRSKLEKISAGFKNLLRIANVGWTRVSATA
jgi:transcriptional regulator with XRE-family HTH domain